MSKPIITVDALLIAAAVGIPERMITGQSTGFTSEYWAKAHRHLDYLMRRSTPFARYGTRWHDMKIKKPVHAELSQRLLYADAVTQTTRILAQSVKVC